MIKELEIKNSSISNQMRLLNHELVESKAQVEFQKDLNVKMESLVQTQSTTWTGGKKGN